MNRATPARLRRHARGAALVVTATASVLVLAACSSGSAAAPSEANLTGSAVSAADDVTGLCAQVVAQKLPPEAASPLLESSGYVVRVDGVGASAGASAPAASSGSAAATVVLTVSGGVVTACALG